MNNQSNYGQGSTFEHADKELYLSIEKEITKFPWPRIELVKRIGGFSQVVNSSKIEWSRRDNRPVKANIVTGTTSSGTSVSVDASGVFNVDDLVESASGEQFVVEAVNGGTQLTLRRWAGDAAEIVGGSVLKRIGGATPEGKKADNMVRSGYEDLYNYTSILEDVVDLSGTENEALIRGAENSGQLIARKLKELAEVWQSQMVLGKRQKDDTFKTRTCGGLDYMIRTYAPQNIVNFGGTATYALTGDDGIQGKLDDALDLISAKVFDKPTMYVGAKFMRKFKYLMSDTIRTDQVNDSRGIGVVGNYLSHLYGKVQVVLIQERTGFMDNRMFFVDESDLGQKAMKGRDWQTYPLARVGDSFRWQILSERTVKVGNPAAHVLVENLGF